VLDGLIAGAGHIFVPGNLLFLFAGTALGIVFGAIPGLTATMGLALLVPFTFSMEPASGLIMLAGIYVGAMYGDSVPAILINTPGTPAAIATTFDGYPLAQKGMAQHALVAAAFASCFGSLLAFAVLAGAAEALAEMSLVFGPAEYFWLGIFGLTIISVLSSGNLIKGFVTATIGLLLSTVGMATLAGDVRLTFGHPELQGGIGLAGALIGFFCLPEILSNVIGRRRDTFAGEQVKPSLGIITSTVIDLLKRPVLMVRSALIGLVVGIAPGAGGNIASMVSYSEARRWERDNHEFGQGTTRGVAASEAANSAMAPGSMIPLLTLGIPGSPPAAVILGALMLHGMQPGNDLFAIYADVTYAFIGALAIASIAVLILGTLGSFVYARIINIRSSALAPVILLMTVMGSYAIRNNMLDVWVMLIFGIIGFALHRLNYQPAPLVLGFILGPYIENGLVQSMMIGGASGSVLTYMTTRPISLILIALCLISALWPLVVSHRQRATPDSGKAVATESGKTGVNTDCVMGITMLVLSAIVFFSTRELSRFGGIFIHYCAAVAALLGIMILIKSQWRADYQTLFDSSVERSRVLTGVVVIAGYLVLVPITGFLAASVVFYFIVHTMLHQRNASRAALLARVAIAVGVSTGMYLLFQEVLHVPLPRGTLFG
jgi:putative tricarboxylic transport membrane protein